MATQSKQIIKDNNLDHIVEVIHGKVEDIKELPDGFSNVCFLTCISRKYFRKFF